MRFLFIFLLVVTVSQFGWAQQESPMKQTQEFLKNKKERDAEIKKSPEAVKVDNYVSGIAGSDAEKEQMYDMASEIFGNFDGKSPEEMQEILKQASGDPKKFYDSLTPAQKAKISGMAKRISDSKKKP